MQIDDKLIAYLEDLSCLMLTDGEKKLLAGDLEKILNGMAQLSKLETENVPELSHPIDTVNVFREDKIKASFDRALILKNAPAENAEMFTAPQTLEFSDGAE